MQQSAPFTPEAFSHLEPRLNSHPLYQAIRNLDDLRCFMEHHIFAVWDFMSLLKYLQNRLAPTSVPWNPHANPASRFLINQIVLGEESDVGLPGPDGKPTYASHFELYAEAMQEVGADPAPAIAFATDAAEQGLDAAFRRHLVPTPAQKFMRSTFDTIATDKPHVVGAAFAMGREHVIPEMFRAFLASMGITPREAPAFHYYLERHIHLDEDFHAPLAMRMMEELIDGDRSRRREAEVAAVAAIEARITLWDGVLETIKQRRQLPAGSARASASLVSGRSG